MAKRLRRLAASSPAGLIAIRLRWGPLGTYIWLASRIPGWTRADEALALARTSHALPQDAVIVEIGSFLGRSAVVLAGARKLRGSGKVHCVDPFDASGDAFSVPIYREIRDAEDAPLRQRFDDNIRRAGLEEWVEVHQGGAAAVAAAWSGPVDLLFMDGDQSFEGVSAAFAAWSPFLRPGSIVAAHNSRPGPHHESHDGHARLAAEVLQPPAYADLYRVSTTTFVRKV